MADLSKLKRKGLGAPPPVEEASPNLAAPETAPHHPAARSPRVKVDMRSARASGRTEQFATRVTPDFDRRIREIAVRDGLLLVEVLERALDAYEAAR